jgi:hypothetical protein
LCFASGLAVTNALVQGLEPGDHIVAPDDVYWGVRKVIGEVFGKWGLDVSYVDMTSIDDFHAALRPNTRLVWVETPSNPLMKITDLPAIAALSRAASPNIVTVCDGTFATPVLQRPLECGIDMVAHSTTKYLSGHSDVIGGALITKNENYLFERARKSQRYGGSVPSPFDCWLTRRGIDTLPWRVRAQSENAMRVVQFLDQHRAVEKVHYPGLPSHPAHKVAALTYMTDELLQDGPAAEQATSKYAAEELVFQINNAIINGSGAGKPLGIMNAACTVSVAKETGQAAATIVLPNVVKMFARLHAGSRAKAVWFVNQDTLSQLYQLNIASTLVTFMAMDAGMAEAPPADGLADAGAALEHFLFIWTH